MPPPQLKTGITSAFHQKAAILSEPAPAFQKPTLKNVPPSLKRQQSSNSGKTDPASDDDLNQLSTRSESDSPNTSGITTPMDVDTPITASIAWGTLIFKTRGVKSFSLPASTPLSLTQPSYTIGRGKDCAVEINAQGVSKEHCRVFLNNGNAFVEDLR